MRRPRQTSLEAYRAIRSELPSKQAAVYRVLMRAKRPVTASEITDRFPELGGAWKRLSELRDRGLAEECEKRRCPITGRKAITWRALDPWGE